MVTLFPIDWRTGDYEANEEYRAEIHAWGKTIDGQSALVRITFTPYFFVKTPGWSEARQRLYISEAAQKYKALYGSSMAVKRIPLLGFTNNTPASFLQLAFPTIEAFRKAKYGIAREKMSTFEASLDPLLRFFHVRDIQPAHWITVKDVTPVTTDDPSRISDEHILEYTAAFTSVDPATDINAIPKLVVASWDLECVSESGLFPDSSKERDQIITIGTAFQRYGETEPYLRSAITLRSCDPIPGVEVLSFENEHEVINAWLQLLKDQEVDVMIGYNTLGFDYKYLDGRNSILVTDDGESSVRLHLLGKSLVGGGVPIEKNLSSAAYGDNKYFYLSSPGVMCLDLLQIFRKELKLESYSLNNVSKKYLDDGEEKIDLKPGEIFQKFTEGSAQRAEIAAYCVRDVELPLKLMRRLSTLENTLQMANAVCCPIDYLQNRGQQIRVFSQLIRKARSLGFVCPDIDRSSADGPQEKYSGATVLNADRGAYFDIVSALDFASLYPSIIRAHNMCPSTLVFDPKYAAIEGIEYYEIETGAGTARFAQDVKCVVPQLLEELAEFRKQAKKDMAAAKDRGDTFQASVYNAKQLAYKVSMNSVYGFFGATRGMLPLVQMAAAVTATGRHMIEHSKKMAEDLVPGTKVIYGDSVAGYTPLVLKNDLDGIRYTTFDALARCVDWNLREDGKEVALCPGEFVWSEKGWTPLQCLIRHRIEKGMVRVVTSSGLVDCTTDHSLLTPDGRSITPSDVTIGTELLHHPLPTTNTDPLVAPLFTSQGSDTFAYVLDGDNHLALAQLIASGVSLGYAFTFQEHDDTAQIIVRFQKHPVPMKRAHQWKIIALHPIGYTGSYVYDCTTENHHFAAGIGTMVVHNTDSILCRFNVAEDKRYDMHEHFRVAQWVADEITKTFKHPIELEFEKTYYPYLLFSKKRYAGLMYTDPDAPEYIDVKGLQLVRRDNAPIVKDVSQDILNIIMHERSPPKAFEAARGSILKVLHNKEPLEKFIISKALRSGYKNPGSLPHVVVADKLKQRRGYPPALGERVPYVFVRDAAKPDGLQAARAEDPDYVRETDGVELDTLYYIQNQLISPITTLLEVLVENSDDVHAKLLGHHSIKAMVDELTKQKSDDVRVAKRVRTNTANKQREITSFFKI